MNKAIDMLNEKVDEMIENHEKMTVVLDNQEAILISLGDFLESIRNCFEECTYDINEINDRVESLNAEFSILRNSIQEGEYEE